MAQKAYSHLTQDQRAQIEVLHREGYSMRNIGRTLNRSHSTISRELKRNFKTKIYQPDFAHKLSVNRRKVASSRPRKLIFATKNFIDNMILNTQASPEQISGRLNLEKGLQISHQAIYNYIKRDKKEGGQLHQNLRHRGKKYKKQAGKNAGRGVIKNRVGIEKRPLVASSKTRFGDFELDTMIGKNHKGRVLSIVDKASKYAIFIHLAQTSAKIVAHKICQALKPFAQKKGVCTLTSDNGKEFAAHELVKQLLPIEGFFFANPYASYERGLNEHTNGVFRQYFSKSTDFTKITQADLDKVADRINNRPRKSLKYQTPLEAMRRLLARRQSGALQC